MRIRRGHWTILPILLVAHLAGCGRQPLHVSVSEEVERPPSSAVLFFVDGMDETRLNELLAAGKLPNIQKRFVDGGVRVSNAITSLPALTYPNTVSLFTGTFPGHHGIVSNQLFDRDRLTWIDYITPGSYQHVNQDFDRPTIYEVLHDRFTVNVQCPTHRGVTQTLDNMIETGPAWFLGWHIPVNQYVASCIEQVGALAQKVRRWPSLVTFYFPGLDAAGHAVGSHTDYYAQVFEDVDFQIGRVTNSLESVGLLEHTYLVLVTDHGHPKSNKSKTFDLSAWLCRTRKVRCHEGPVPGAEYSDRYAFLDKYDVMLVDGSHRRMAIFLRGGRGWGSPPSSDAIKSFIEGPVNPAEKNSLVDTPAIEYACRRLSPDMVEVRAAKGVATVERRIAGPVVEYRLSSEGDPLGLVESPEMQKFTSQGWHDSRAWLAMTARSRHPDFVPQIVEYFDSPRAGDVVVFLTTDWLLTGHEHGEHGSCLAEDMRIPMFFAGPGISRGATIESGRLADVMPTLIELLGEGGRLGKYPPLDGVSLASQLKAAQPVAP